MAISSGLSLLRRLCCFSAKPLRCRGGGLLTLINSNLVHSARTVLSHTSAASEVLAVEIKLSLGTLTVCNVYCPHGFYPTDTLALLLRASSPNLLVMGDFNSHHTLWDARADASGRRLWSWLLSSGFTVMNAPGVTFGRGVPSSAIDLTP